MRLPRFALAVLALLALLVPGTAHAYLDPGAGSMLLQLLVGGVAGLAVLLRLFWRKVVAFFAPKRREPDERIERP